MAKKKSHILLRIDPELSNDLNLWAKDELRSLNGQIEYVLRQAVRKRRGKRPQGEDDLPPVDVPAGKKSQNA
ncbi:MAG: Arc family DNA-binding protein [Dehalococcoidia bacterium]